MDTKPISPAPTGLEGHESSTFDVFGALATTTPSRWAPDPRASRSTRHAARDSAVRHGPTPRHRVRTPAVAPSLADHVKEPNRPSITDLVCVGQRIIARREPPAALNAETPEPGISDRNWSLAAICGGIAERALVAKAEIRTLALPPSRIGQNGLFGIAAFGTGFSTS